MQGTGGGRGKAADVGGGSGEVGHGGERCWCCVAQGGSLETAASIGQGAGQVKCWPVLDVT